MRRAGFAPAASRASVRASVASWKSTAPFEAPGSFASSATRAT
jgi:hypothetical protein